MAGNLLLTGLSALTASKRALDTTGHNIANVGTAGYSRQSVELNASTPQLSGAGYIGSGVTTTTVTRSYNEFLSTQFRSSSSATAELDSYLSLATQIDSILTNENIGLTGGLQSFFNAVQTVSDDPTSIPARQVLLTEGSNVATNFGTLDRLFEDLTSQVNGSLGDTVSDINNLAESIAALNNKIVIATGVGAGNTPNDLLDQRDYLVDQLSQKVNVSTNAQDNGALNVFIGSGQALVLNGQANSLDIKSTGYDLGAVDIVLKQKSGDIAVTQFMTGGEIGGIIRFRDEILDPSIASLGQIAMSFSHAVNEQHKNGLDLNDTQGLDFFTEPVITPIKLTNTAGAGSLAVSVANTVELTTSDYEVVASGGNYTITRLSDNSEVVGSRPYATSVTVDGLTFDTTSLLDGDSYRVRPTRDAAGQISLFIKDPREIAAAAPVISAVNPLNTGTGDISSVSVSGLEPATLSTVTLTYNDVTSRYDIIGATPGTLAYTSAANNGEEYTIAVAGFGNIKLTLTGNPAAGDTITLTDNAGGIGDNRNLNLLSDLQKALTLTGDIATGGTASFQDAYGSIVSTVGRNTQSAEANGLAQRGLLTQITASKDSVSGVSLDEEAANLIKHQQAYQAASQVILTSRSIFDTLLGIFR